MNPAPLKRCTLCKSLKLLDKFQKCTKSPDGLYQHCRMCHNESRRKPKEQVTP